MSREPRRKGRPKSFNAKPSQTTIQSLERALDVLDTIASSSGMTLTEIATALNQSPATIYRVLTTLEAREIVEIEPETQDWYIGHTAFRLGTAFLRRTNLVERCRQAMRDLLQATGETSNLGVEVKNKVMFVSQAETQESIRAFFPPGTISPMHASGIGKALLSHYSDDRIERILKATQMEQFTEKTISAPDALKQDLKVARSRGWAFDDEEKTMGMRCVAAPILDIYSEAVAGISVSGPTNRMPEERIAEFGELVKAAAAKVSQGLS